VPPEDHKPTPPTIPDYELLRLIGRGSYGDVWLGRGATGLYRAIKVVWLDRFEDPEPYEREFRGLTDFMRRTEGENRQMALLHVGRNTDQGWFHYVMELADDVITGNSIDPDCYAPLTLRVLRDQAEPVPAEDVLTYAIELAAGLADLHATGLVHRDIKPSNIIVVNGRPKLADIGQVSVARETMSVVGTEGFIPTEGPGTPAADIFSLGKVLYEMAMGEDRQNFPSLPADLSERPDRQELLELNEVIVKACAPQADERHSDALALLEELKLLQAGKSVRRLRFAERGVARARKWIAAVAVIAAIAATGAAWERNRANQEAAGRKAAEAELAELTRRTLYDASLAAAQRALETENYGVAREALERTIPRPGDPDLRGFAWHALWFEAQGDPAEIIRESGDTVTRLEASRDGRWVAVDNTHLTLDLFDQKTGEFVRTFEGIHRVAGFSPDGNRMVGSTPDYQIETWSIADGSVDNVPNKLGVNRPLQVHPELPHLLYFEDSTDDGPHHLGIWDFARGEIVVEWPITNREGDQWWVFHGAAASDDLQTVFLAISSGRGTEDLQKVGFINMESGSLAMGDPTDRTFTPIGLSPDGSIYATSDEVIAWGNTNNPTQTTHQTKQRAPSGNLRFDQSSSRILASIEGNKAIDIRITPAVTIREFAGSNSQVSYLTFDAEDRFIWSADSHGQVRRWLADQTKAKTTSETFHSMGRDDLSNLEIGPDARTLVATRGNNRMHIWDYPSLTSRWERDDATDLLDIAHDVIWFINDQQRIVAADALTGDILRRADFGENDARVHSATASRSGKRWLVETVDGQILLWDTVYNKVHYRIDRAALDLQGQHLVAYVLREDDTVLSTDSLQRLMLWSARDGSILRQKSLRTRPNRLTLSADENMVAVSGGYSTSQILRLSDFTIVREFFGTRSSGIDVTFHPRAPLIATQVLSGSIELINYENGWKTTPLTLLNDGNDIRRGQVSHLTFAPNGSSLAVATVDGVIRLWRTE